MSAQTHQVGAHQLPMYRDRGHIQGSFLHRKARRLAGGGEEAFIVRGSKATVFVYFQKKRKNFGRPSVVDGANGRLFLELCDFLEIHMQSCQTSRKKTQNYWVASDNCIVRGDRANGSLFLALF